MLIRGLIVTNVFGVEAVILIRILESQNHPSTIRCLDVHGTFVDWCWIKGYHYVAREVVS